VDDQQQSRWWPTRSQVLWAGSIVGVIALLLLIRLGYAHRWTGFGQYKVNGEVQPFKTLWDWLDLLIVPIVLALGGYLFTRSENRRTQDIADQQRDLDRQIADDRRQDDTLQAYLDGMSQLLTDKDRPLHEAQLGDSLSTIARARTLTVLSRLDGDRKRSVVQFLYEAKLISKDRAVLDLKEADLSGANLSEGHLPGAYLRWTRLREANLCMTDLRDADLSEADLGGGDLRRTNLSNANLNGAGLREADLRWANLPDADLSEPEPLTAKIVTADLSEADLREANLINANLSGARLVEANLRGADLRWAKLINANVTNKQLAECASLEGATLPNGQKYEDWLKSKGSGEDGANAGPS